MTEFRDIFCCKCGDVSAARLTTGSEVYPHRPDLSQLPFWRCDRCGNFVGTHNRDRRKGQDRLRPLGTIPTRAIRRVRAELHRRMDRLWRDRKVERRALYARLSEELGREYHTGEVNSYEEAQAVYAALRKIEREIR